MHCRGRPLSPLRPLSESMNFLSASSCKLCWWSWLSSLGRGATKSPPLSMPPLGLFNWLRIFSSDCLSLSFLGANDTYYSVWFCMKILSLGAALASLLSLRVPLLLLLCRTLESAETKS